MDSLLRKTPKVDFWSPNAYIHRHTETDRQTDRHMHTHTAADTIFSLNKILHDPPPPLENMILTSSVAKKECSYVFPSLVNFSLGQVKHVL